MQDRFKFRAYHIPTKQLYYSAEETYDYMKGYPNIPCESFGELLNNEKYIIEQCIGFRDCCNCPIYEGDIIERFGVIYKVVWNSLDGVYELKEKSGFCSIRGNKYFYEQSSILGDVHTKPDLLELDNAR